MRNSGKGKEKGWEKRHRRKRLERVPLKPSSSQAKSQEVAAPLRHKAGMVWHWIEEDNKSVEITGIRWLPTREVGSFLAIYMKSAEEPSYLRMSSRLLHTTRYDPGRGKEDKITVRTAPEAPNITPRGREEWVTCPPCKFGESKSGSWGGARSICG